MIKLSLKRLQPNWPCDEVIGNRLSAIRQTDGDANRSPTKTILKNIWLKSLPIGRSHITTIRADNLAHAHEQLETLNLINYMRYNNPRIEINNNTITSILHIAFNMMGLLHQRWHESGGILFDYVKSNNERANNIIEQLFFGLNPTLNISYHNINLLRVLLVGRDCALFWQEIRTQYEALMQHSLYISHARVFGDRHLRFPARRSGFCSRENVNNIQCLAPSDEDSFIRPLLRPRPTRLRSQELNVRIQECVHILDTREISEVTRFHIYELILACTNDTL